MLKQRFLTAAIVLLLFIAATWFGEYWFTLFIAVVAVLSGLEFYRMARYAESQPITYLGIAWIALFVLSPHCPNTIAAPLLITAAIVVSLSWLLFRLPRKQAFNNWAWTMAGIFYVGWMLSYWIYLRGLESGVEWVLYTMLVVAANDTGAFFIGRAWGRHFLVSAISPSKTWEGAIGGLLAAVIGSLILGLSFSLPINYWHMIVLGCVISLSAQLGDLVESLLKRNAGSKDSGKLMPGHGGMLDRADSAIFTGVIVYYYVIFFIL